MVSKLNRFDGTRWVNVPDMSGVKYWNGTLNRWFPPESVRRWDGTRWVEVWAADATAGLPPRTFTFRPTALATWRPPSTWRPRTQGRIGSYGSGDHWFLLDFTDATDVATGVTITAALATRPRVTAVSVRLTRTGGGFQTINSGTYYIGYNTGGFASGSRPVLPSTSRSIASLSGAQWRRNTARTFPISQTSLPNQLKSNEMIVANTLSPRTFTQGGGFDNDYTVMSNQLSDYLFTFTSGPR